MHSKALLPVLLILSLLFMGGCASTPDESEVVAAPETAAAKVRRLRIEITADPNNAELSYQLGNALYDIGNYGEAAFSFEHALAQDPQMAKGWTNLGLTLRKLGKLKASIGAYETALDIIPDDKTTLHNLWAVAELLGDWDRVIWCAKQLVDLDPDSTDALAELGRLYMTQGQYDLAARQYERLILRDPTVAADYYNLGLCNYELARWEATEAAWARAVELVPDHPSANKGLAVLYWELGNYDQAWAWVQRCQQFGISLDPAFIATLENDSTTNP